MLDWKDFIIDEYALEGYSVEDAKELRENSHIVSTNDEFVVASESLGSAMELFGFGKKKDNDNSSGSGPVEYIPDAAIKSASSKFDSAWPKMHSGKVPTIQEYQGMQDAISSFGVTYGNVESIVVRDIYGYGGNCYIEMNGGKMAKEKNPSVIAATRSLVNYLKKIKFDPRVTSCNAYDFHMFLTKDRQNYSIGMRFEKLSRDGYDEFIQ